MPRKERQPESGAVRLPSADGYHPGDDRPWDQRRQEKLIGILSSAAKEARAAKPVGGDTSSRGPVRWPRATTARPEPAVTGQRRRGSIRSSRRTG
jgi:hypothetical protein